MTNSMNPFPSRKSIRIANDESIARASRIQSAYAVIMDQVIDNELSIEMIDLAEYDFDEMFEDDELPFSYEEYQIAAKRMTKFYHAALKNDI